MNSARTDEQYYDLIIVGTGAGGGTMARAMAASGRRILVLERGDYLPRETENWDSSAVFIDERYHSGETWFDGDGKSFHPQIHYYVGGNTKVYGAALFRFRESDFCERRHVDGMSPAWPLGYDVFEPYYQRAEEIYNVHGLRGTDPTEPPSKSPYPYPPVQDEPRIAWLGEQLRKAGLQPFPLPLGLHLNEDDWEASACIKCGTCDGYPCLVRAKSDAHVNGIEPALSHGNVTLLRNAKVEMLETSNSGREVTAVLARIDSELVRYRGDVVVLSCGAIHSAELLLRSASDAHPDGLANASGVVGRHYMAHNNSAMTAISGHANPTKFQKTIGVNDFYEHDEAFGFPLGHVQLLGKSQGAMFRGAVPGIVPGWALDTIATHGIDFWLTTEDLPLPESRVIPRRDGSLTLHYVPSNVSAHETLVKRFSSIVRGLDTGPAHMPTFVTLAQRIPLAGTAHQCGTVRFGIDRTSSALDTDCRAHDIANLYVVDGSFFPSSSAVNPGLTIMANALRVADHLLTRLSGRSHV